MDYNSFPTYFYGHLEAAQEISQLAAQGRLPQALLLQGPQGIGKFRFAMALAAALVYDEIKNFDGFSHPAGGGKNKLVAHLDGDFLENVKILTVDDPNRTTSKSTLAMEDIRSTQDFFALKSRSDKWRVAIIDCADALSPKGANAFLKILEDPPQGSLIILLSHASSHLLPTIRSRCHLQPMQKLSLDETSAAIADFEELQDQENHEAAYLKELVALCGGCPGQAKSILKLGGQEFLRDLNFLTGPKGSGVNAVAVIESIFNRSKLDGEEKTFKAFVDILLETSANNFISQSNTQGGYNDDRFVENWFKVHRQVQDTLTFSLDKKASCLSILHQLTSPHVNITWSHSVNRHA